MTRGMRIRNETVLTISSSGSRWERERQLSKSWVRKDPSPVSTAWACPVKRRVKARRAEQMWTACQKRLRTRTGRSSMGGIRRG